MALKGLIASVILCWAKALGEFGATVMLAGAMPGKTETMPIAIFAALASANIDKTIVLILILAFFGLCTLYAVRLTGEGDAMIRVEGLSILFETFKIMGLRYYD